MPRTGRTGIDDIAKAAAKPARPPFERALGDLILAMGEPDFADRFARTCVDQCAADQITAFVLDDAGARCVLAHRPSDPRLVASLCDAYTGEFVARDPLLEPSRAADGGFETRRLAAREIVDRRYRDRLFRDVGLAGKISAIARWDRRTLYVNLYFREAAGARLDSALETLSARGPLLMSCLHKHDRLIAPARTDSTRPRAEAFLRRRFPALSPREIEACALILSGCTIEGVARAMAVSPATAITFRKRAYAKMSIASRGDLFARCVALGL